MSRVDAISRRSRKRARFVLFAVLASVTGPALAIAPEPGIYESASAPGSGLVIDHQGDRLAIGLYSYDPAAGQQVFYVGSSALRDDGFSVSPSIDAPLDTRGFYPLHWGEFDLFRTANGVCFPCGVAPTPVEMTPAGSLRLYFADAGVVIASYIRMDTRPNPARTIAEFRRVNFGRSTVGRTPDLAGQWVFVDADDAGKAAWRFAFGSPEIVGGPYDTAPTTFVYRDVEGRGTMSCKYGQPAEGALVRVPGCELAVDGTVLFAFKHMDVGVHRMQGAYGDLPYLVQFDVSGGGPYRRPGNIVGVRIETP